MRGRKGIMSPRPWILASNPEKIILLVDDDRDNLLLLQISLEAVGCTVLCASDGMEALEVYNKVKEHVALIITDNHMPHMTGAELFFHLKRKREKVPVMMVSADTNKNTIHVLTQAGLDGYLPKPFDLDDFVSMVKSLLVGAQD
jgi:CheY-like chemotaxis protein